MSRARPQPPPGMPKGVDKAVRDFLALKLPPETPAFVGVSGGRDSMALLDMLVELGYRALTVCHLDHTLRPESAAEARFVEKTAHSLGLECVLGKKDVRALAKKSRRSLETAARNARHEFFAQVAADRSTPCVLLLAHHADDQVETFLFNLFRGAGPGGLRGIPADSRLRIAIKNRTVELRVLRPLLPVWRSEIDDYVQTWALPFCEDASNGDPAFTRNRLRHQLLPVLEETFGRDVRRAIWRAAELLRAEDEWMSTQVPALDEVVSVAVLRALPEALQRRLLHAWLKAQGVPEIGFELIEALRALAEPQSRRSKLNLPGLIFARRRAGQLFLEKAPPRSAL